MFKLLCGEFLLGRWYILNLLMFRNIHYIISIEQPLQHVKLLSKHRELEEEGYGYDAPIKRNRRENHTILSSKFVKHPQLYLITTFTKHVNAKTTKYLVKFCTPMRDCLFIPGNGGDLL